MLLVVASLLVFAAIFSLVVGLSWRNDTALDSRMAKLRGDESSKSYRASVQQDSVGTRVIGPLAGSLGQKLENVLPTSWVRSFERQLISAGEPITLKGFLVAAFLTEAVLLLFGLTILSAGNLQGMKGIIAVIAAAGLGLYMPKMWLSSRVRGRQKIILKSLPDAFDLVTTCVEAGLGLDAALARVAEKEDGPFGEELTITLREISLGKLRRDALKQLSDRCGIDDLTTFVNAVIQAESMGTSIATVLRVQADQMRTRRRQRAEEQAQQAPVKMIFPLVLCIFPTLFIVILGPAALSVYDQLIKG